MSSYSRCPQCGSFLRLSYIESATNEQVYQCSSIAVEIRDARGHLRNKTLDHSARFFIRKDDTYKQVEPVALAGGGQWSYKEVKEET